MGASPLLEHIEAIEYARQRAMVAKDMNALTNVLADDLIYVHATGTTMTKTEYLNHIRPDSFAYESLEASTMRHAETKDSFVLVQRLAGKMRIGERRLDTKLVVLTVWRKAQDGWKVIASISSKIPE